MRRRDRSIARSIESACVIALAMLESGATRLGTRSGMAIVTGQHMNEGAY
ncbi:hypothetical protein [Burkholderia sp. Nafp2/4-1b]|nr:hypothetical protein [Burkholderia sp. Nafp2/4-1b]